MKILSNICHVLKNKFTSKGLICKIGKCEILENEIIFDKYPFEPSIAFQNKKIKSIEIISICVNFGLCKILTKNDVIFISSENKNKLVDFANNNKIKLIEHSWNWDWILEPYLDTEFSEKDKFDNYKLLQKKGFEKKEVDELRDEVGKQMYKYNFHTMLWEWNSLDLFDVLSAMRAKYNKTQFKEFYIRAIEIENRN